MIETLQPDGRFLWGSRTLAPGSRNTCIVRIEASRVAPYLDRARIPWRSGLSSTVPVAHLTSGSYADSLSKTHQRLAGGNSAELGADIVHPPRCLSRRRRRIFRSSTRRDGGIEHLHARSRLRVARVVGAGRESCINTRDGRDFNKKPGARQPVG
jgi:hypothetical protein